MRRNHQYGLLHRGWTVRLDCWHADDTVRTNVSGEANVEPARLQFGGIQQRDGRTMHYRTEK